VRAIQNRFGGSVILCLDVSGSMYGEPLQLAVRGCIRFVDQALEAGYEVSVLFWHHGIEGYTPLGRHRNPLVDYLRRAQAGGGNDICPTLRHAEAELVPRRGDLVVAIFGDGDLGDEAAAKREADRLRAKSIRIITCGLGQASAESLDVISTEDGAGPRTADTDRIADSIADMASGLRARPRGPTTG
jgi:uncharacterized protein with von Willebrand factor type A (vWA) domain